MPAPCLAVIPAELTVVAVNAAFLRAAALSEEDVLGGVWTRSSPMPGWTRAPGTPPSTPVLDVDGGVSFILHALEDVTALTRAQQELRAMERVVAETTAARNEAQRTSQLKTRFLGMISHELRTPLTALCLQVERMQRNGACLEQRQKRRSNESRSPRRACAK